MESTKERTVVYINVMDEEFEVGLREFFTEDYLTRRGDEIGLEQEARTILKQDFVRFGWREVSSAS